MTSATARPRAIYVALLLVTILLGLASRHFSHRLPLLLAKNAGDILYATMSFWLVGLLFPRLATAKVACAALAFCFAIEFAKFIQTPWAVAVRHRAWGHLIFGSGFHGSNLACYVTGVLLGVGIEYGLRRQWVKRAGTKASV